MPLTIERTTEEFLPNTVKAIMFGRPGAGKTALSLQYPNPLIVAAEMNFMSIAGQNVPFIRCNDLATYKEIIRIAKLSSEEREKEFGFPVGTLIIDTIDELQISLMREKYNTTKLDYDGWAWIATLMSDSVKALGRVEDLNVIYNCHIKEATTPGEDGEDRASYQPALMGGFRDVIPGLVDLAFMIEPKIIKVPTKEGVMEVTEKWFITQPNDRYPFLKDGSPGSLPSRVKMDFETDFQRIFDLVYLAKEGAKEAEEAKIAASSAAAASFAATPEVALTKPPVAAGKS